MNSEHLRRLPPSEILSTLERQVTMAKNYVGAFRTVTKSDDPGQPLLTIGDFDIYPRAYGPAEAFYRSKLREMEKELAYVINRHSMENGSNTPDWILGHFLAGCLASWDEAVSQREKYYGRGPLPGPMDQGPAEPPPEPPKP